jgi:hypothetical protein
MEAALYARVSSEEQVEGYSIDAQIRAFETLVEAKGWTIYKEYIEEGKSARTENINKRPVFKEAIADGLDQRYDILVVHKVDRFSRKLRITLEYFDKLGKAEVGFVSIVEQMDFSTPWGKFTLSMRRYPRAEPVALCNSSFAARPSGGYAFTHGQSPWNPALRVYWRPSRTLLRQPKPRNQKRMA